MSRAIGMLETYGLLPAVEGLDAALKAANVSLRSFNYVSGGLVAWIVEGEVGAVRVAVSAGKAAAVRLGKVTGDHVIPRPAGEVADTLPPTERPGGRKGGTNIHKNEFPVGREEAKPSGQANGGSAEPAKPETAPVAAPEGAVSETGQAVEAGDARELKQAPAEGALAGEEAVQDALSSGEEQTIDEERTIDEKRRYTREELESRRFNELRSMARRIDDFSMTRYEIRDATKSRLIQGILDAQDKGGERNG